MNVWESYIDRTVNRGCSVRNADRRREVHNIYRRLPNNLSYTTVTIDDDEQIVAIINSDNLNEKRIISMPGEDIRHGGLVDWMDNHWLITERDANTTIYARGKMVQCNYLLKWVSEDNVIHEQWCIVEDGTKLERTRCALWFGIPETVCKNYPLNCWNTLRAARPQRNHEIRISAKVKNRARLGNQQPSPEQGKVQRLCR